jgi:8-oxo-dGTP diphosphatase
MREDMKEPHCAHCGTAHIEAAYPRTCQRCLGVSYKNPTPVGVVIVPVAGDGVLLIRRGEEPKKGELALPGGYLELGETWQEGSVRELNEEVGIQVRPNDLYLFDVRSTGNDNLLIFSVTPPQSPVSIPKHLVNPEEVSELVVVTEPVELGFPTHTAALKRFFSTR